MVAEIVGSIDPILSYIWVDSHLSSVKIKTDRLSITPLTFDYIVE